MDANQKILLLDDDPDLLDMPAEAVDVVMTNKAYDGKTLLELMKTDFARGVYLNKITRGATSVNIPVLSIVRRKYPQLRTVVLTSVVDEQFRSRVYALGVDLFWHKPGTEQEIKMFLECLESLLGRETEGGFRGIQSKSLVDIIQLECITHSSSVLRITNGPLSGKIWILDGELIDAEAGELSGQAARPCRVSTCATQRS